MSSPRFGRVITAMITPFDEHGEINFDVARDVAKFLVEDGSDGLVVAGSTGEGSSLSDREKLDLFACVAEAVTVPVLAGSTSADTRQSVALTSQVRATGAAGVLSTTPAYARPSQQGIALHMQAVASSTDLPVMLYDIPSRTGRKIYAETTISLVRENANIVALKDASSDLEQAGHVKAVLGDDLDLYSGDDSLTLDFMAIGGVGIVSVAGHWASREFATMVAKAVAGNWDEARVINESLRESCLFEGSEQYPNPMPSKAALRFLGIPVGECRLPHAPSDGTLNARAAQVVGSLRASRG
jgi:4-hydroxy-tetrahydrodipicolinate synthase